MKLTVDHLSFAYHKKPVLQEVSLALDQGEVLCVLGPNGVGKSTLFRCILGLQRGYGGSVCLGGDEIRTLPPKEIARRIAYIPQSSAPIFRYSVFNSVLMGTTSQLSTLSSPGKEQEEAANHALEVLGISHLRDRTAGSLSGGERQLMLIARALAQNSPLLVMDEPTASLDYGNAIRVMEMVRSLSERGYGVILSTHDPEQALRYGNRALVLGRGKVRAFGSPEAAITSELLSQVYNVPIRIESMEVDGVYHHVCIPADPVRESNRN